MVKMEVDDVLVMIGGFGRYQQIWFFLLGLTGIGATITNLNIVFLMAVPDHWCFIPGLDGLNLSLSEKKSYSIPKEVNDGNFGYSSCLMYERNYSVTENDVRDSIGEIGNGSYLVGNNLSTTTCRHGWAYDTSVYTSTLVTQFDLVCDQRWLQVAGKSIFFAGIMVGVLLFGIISDMFGRRKSLLIAMVLLVITNVAQAFAPHVVAFLVFRFLGAMGNLAGTTTAFVIVLEITGPFYRADVGIGGQYFWATGYLALAGIAFLIRDHFYLQLSVSLPLVCFVYLYWVAPDTARWLYANNRKEEGEAMLSKMAEWNKAQLPENVDIIVQKGEHRANISDLFRTPRLRCWTINLGFNWMVNSMVYYGLSLNSSLLAGDPYLNFFISGAVEIPAYVMSHVTMKYAGRRWPHCILLVLAGVALLATIAVPKDMAWVTTVLTMFGKFCITATFAIVYLFSGEIFPTVVRQVGVSTGSFCSRVGGITSPYIALLGDINHLLPSIVFGALSVSAGLLTLLLPETKGKALPQTIEEGEVFGTKKSNRQEPEGRLNPSFVPDIAQN